MVKVFSDGRRNFFGYLGVSSQNGYPIEGISSLLTKLIEVCIAV